MSNPHCRAVRKSCGMRQLGFLVFLLLVYGPVIALAIAGMDELAQSGRAFLRETTFPSQRQWMLLTHTFLFALSVSVGSIFIGIIAATGLWRLYRKAAKWLIWLVVLFIAVPPYVHALAWMNTLSAANSILERLGFAGLPQTGWPVAWWVEVMTYVPFSVGLTLLGLASVDPEMIEAGRVSRNDFRVFWRIVLPLAVPQILAAGGLIFVLSVTDYGVPSLFQVNVYPLDLYVRYSFGSPPLQTLVLALPLLAVAVVVILCSQAGLRAVVMKPLWSARTISTPLVWPGWFTAIQAVGILLALAQVVVPSVNLILATKSWPSAVEAIGVARKEILTSLWVALVAGSTCLLIAPAVAKTLVETKSHFSTRWLLVVLPLAIPAPLTGIGLIVLWNHPLVGLLHGTMAMPILAALARFAPLAVLVMVAQLRRIDRLLFDAAGVFQTSRTRTWVQVVLPMLAPSLVAANGVVSALSLGELGATLIVAPPGQATLTMRIYSYLHYGASENVAALCLLIAIGTLMWALMTVLAFRLWALLFPNAPEVGV